MVRAIDAGASDAAVNVIAGTEGPDTLQGGDGSDVMDVRGGGGRDSVFGGGGDDFLAGDGGLALSPCGGPYPPVDDDFLDGGGGGTVFGEAGDDAVVGGAGADALFGGPGADRFVFSYVGLPGIDPGTGAGQATGTWWRTSGPARTSWTCRPTAPRSATRS